MQSNATTANERQWLRDSTTKPFENGRLRAQTRQPNPYKYEYEHTDKLFYCSNTKECARANVPHWMDKTKDGK